MSGGDAAAEIARLRAQLAEKDAELRETSAALADVLAHTQAAATPSVQPQAVGRAPSTDAAAAPPRRPSQHVGQTDDAAANVSSAVGVSELHMYGESSSQDDSPMHVHTHAPASATNAHRVRSRERLHPLRGARHDTPPAPVDPHPNAVTDGDPEADAHVRTHTHTHTQTLNALAAAPTPVNSPTSMSASSASYMHTSSPAVDSEVRTGRSKDSLDARAHTHTRTHTTHTHAPAPSPSRVPAVSSPGEVHGNTMVDIPHTHTHTHGGAQIQTPTHVRGDDTRSAPGALPADTAIAGSIRIHGQARDWGASPSGRRDDARSQSFHRQHSHQASSSASAMIMAQLSSAWRNRGESPRSEHGMTDAELAAALQQEEIMRAYARRHAEPVEERQPEPLQRFEDPVWGRFDSPTDKPFPPHAVICIAMCPCCVPPYCSPDRKSRYAQVGRKAAFLIGLVQIALWIASLCFRGVAPTGINSMVGPWADTLDVLQAKNAAAIVYRYELWRLVTPIFLHAGLIHLLTNLLLQWRAGLNVEYTWGTRIWLRIYFGSGIYASAFSAVCIPDQLSVGASGALMGIMGAWLVWLIITWSEGNEDAQSQRSFNFVLVFVNIAVIVGFSFVPFVDWAAHLFGLIGGILLALWLFSAAHIQVKWKAQLFRWGALVMYLASFAASLVALFLATSPNRGLLIICPILRFQYPSAITRCW